MSQIVHGGGVARAAKELGVSPAQILDFSASINPLGMPPEVRDAVVASLDEAVHYPEIDAASLRRDLAVHHRLPGPCLLPASGSTELIYLIPRVLRPRRALVVCPAFGEYARALSLAGCVVDRFCLSPQQGFALDPEALISSLSCETDLVILANPGNPTGVGIPPHIVRELATRLEGRATLMLDEAFVDFCPERSVIEEVRDHPNLLVLRSMTKFYAVPGLRIGYLAASEPLVLRLEAAMLPWSLSTPALFAARACLPLGDYRDRTLEEIAQLRSILSAGLTRLGCEVVAGEANYLLLRLPQGVLGSEVAARLYPQGMLVRSCTDFIPLDDAWLRVAVRTDRENLRLIDALGAALGS